MNKTDIKALVLGNRLRLAEHVLTVHAVDSGKEMITLKYIASPKTAPEDIPPPCIASYDPTRPAEGTKIEVKESPAMLSEEGWKTTVICKWVELANAEAVS